MVRIGNKQLEDYVMFKLDKIENKFTKKDLGEIKEIVLNPINIVGEYEKIDLKVIKNFYNVNDITFKNLEIKEEIINILLKMKCLNSLCFVNCEFVNLSKIALLNVDKISFINCDINDYEFVYEMDRLKSLSIINGSASIRKLNELKSLCFLQLSYSNIIDIESLKLPLLEELYIDNTNIEEISIVYSLNNLKKLSISREQYVKNKNSVERFKQKGISLFNESIVEF